MSRRILHLGFLFILLPFLFSCEKDFTVNPTANRPAKIRFVDYPQYQIDMGYDSEYGEFFYRGIVFTGRVANFGHQTAYHVKVRFSYQYNHREVTGEIPIIPSTLPGDTLLIASFKFFFPFHGKPGADIHYTCLWNYSSGVTGANRRPAEPYNPDPRNNSSGTPIHGSLSWSCDDLDEDALFYDVYLGTEENNLQLIGKRTCYTTINIGELVRNQIYYWQITADDGQRQTQGPVWKFTTADIPMVITADVTEITQKTARCGGMITFSGGMMINECGVCWSKTSPPTISDSKTIDQMEEGYFTSFISGLIANNTYYVRAYAINDEGIGYGEVVSFLSAPFESGIVTDFDGNIYQSVKIGTQWWMAENLKTTHYRNGNPIEHIPDPVAWERMTAGAWCQYENRADIPAAYGHLYNWYAVTDPQGLAPEGWRIPSDADWQALSDALGNTNDAGGKLKQVGTEHWAPPNTGATNESGFTALPGGLRGSDGCFYWRGEIAFFWSVTASDNGSIKVKELSTYSKMFIDNFANRWCGASVRCIKND